MYLRDINGNPYWVPDKSDKEPVEPFDDDALRSCLAHILGWVVGFMLGIIMCALMGCSTHKSVSDYVEINTRYDKQTEVQQSYIDSLTHIISNLESRITETSRRDSSYQSVSRSDTTIINDSTYIVEHPDGTTDRHYWHREYRQTTLHDTIYRRTDTSGFVTIISELRDSIEHIRDSLSSVNQIISSDSSSIHIHDQETVVESSISLWDKIRIALILATILAFVILISTGKLGKVAKFLLNRIL